MCPVAGLSSWRHTAEVPFRAGEILEFGTYIIGGLLRALTTASHFRDAIIDHRIMSSIKLAGMDISIHKYPISDELRTWLLKELWSDSATSPQAVSLSMSPYFDYYSKRCQRFSQDGGIHICVKSHQGLVDITEQILFVDATRSDIQRLLGSRLGGPVEEKRTGAMNTTIDLCGSLLLMAEVGVHEFGYSGCNPLAWSGPQTLRQAVEQHFRCEKELQPDNPRLGALFTARNLEYIGGMKIKWTTNIVDHLLLSDDDQTVFIFHCVGFLRFQQRTTLGFRLPLFPDSFIDETLRTLALLFPQNDRKSRRWLRAQVTEHNLDPHIARCGNLRAQNRRFEHFSFWHDRLIILKQAFDESSPRGLRQWWNDRRNSVQWSTFWVAILVFAMTVFFGLVQSVEGALQVYLSWKALKGEGL
ncbi:hypothetical protein B0T18DRAFT_455215 [Schizothecium vesticola]|uniref:Uncharacterized protein n=1 Tax=Schizothecium vesticola TaxID=314040 RepID=A0AA40KDK1_9PEZI|nr:hypothetical protein B0T18DRAFT_455215 [Schizothecium vesticola]